MTATMIEAAMRGLLFALVVGASLRMFRVSNVPVRKAVWTLVLIASLAMPFLMRAPAVTGWKTQWGWAVPIQLGLADTPWKATQSPRMHATPTVLAAVSGDPQEATPIDTAVLPVSVVSAAPDANPAAILTTASSQTRLRRPSAIRLAIMIYLGVAGVLMIRLMWGLVTALRLWMTAERVSPLVAPEPNVRSSAKIPSPVTIGSGIVLPASYSEWDYRKLRMVLAHERSHVRQMDFYLQLLAGLYTALFWFSPLGWWLRRTLASLAEAIGDRAGMDAAASRSRYAEVLLEFAAMPRQTLPGVAMARPGNLSHRVERLLNEHLFSRAFAEGRHRAMVSLLLIPVALFVATVLIRVPAGAQETPQAPAAPPAPSASTPATPAEPPAPESLGQTVIPPGAEPAPRAPGAPNPPTAPRAPSPAVAPLPAVAPIAPLPPNPDGMEVDDSPDTLVSDDDQELKGYTYGFADNGESYAIIEGPGNDVTFSGSWTNDRKAEIEAARKVAKGPFLWFTHEDKSYIVTDPAIVAKIRAMYQPMEELGHKQEFLGKQQEALGKQMEELSRQQEAAGQVKMPDLSREMAELDQTMAKLNADRQNLNTKELTDAEKQLKAAQDKMLTPEKMAELQSDLAAAQAQWNSERMASMQEKLGELQSRLGELQGEAGARQGEFGEKMGTLGAQQGRLGEQQGRLGAEQSRIAREADRQVRGIIEDSLRNGKATEVPQVK
jgi:beta-lactamase regulating signal transducer with metallopeptidase domain/predicted  nucleic acid-binding Zn-ribbon protein